MIRNLCFRYEFPQSQGQNAASPLTGATLTGEGVSQSASRGEGMAQASLESRRMETVGNNDSTDPEDCPLDGQRQCEDGTCVPRNELCPEEELLSQETILVMIGIAMAVFLLLIFLYCIQQHRHNTDTQQQGVNAEEPNHPELLLIPPPAYDEAVDVALYPPTPQIERVLSTTSEEPTTPPPNYDTALHILAQSEENLVTEDLVPESPNLRRAISADHLGINRCRPMTFSSFGANSKTFSKNHPPKVSKA